MSDRKGLWRINRPMNNQDAPEAAGIRPKCQTPIVWHEPEGGYQEGSMARVSNVLAPGAMIAIQWGVVAGIIGGWALIFLW